MMCCLSSPLAWLLHRCGLASGPLLLSLSFNSPSPHEASQIQPAPKMSLFPDPSCTFPALYLVSPGVRGCSALLTPCEHQQGLPDLLMHQGMQRGASSTGTSCLLSKAKPGSPATWSPTADGKCCSPECLSLLWSCASPICRILGLWLTCLHLLPAGDAADGQYRHGVWRRWAVW